MSSQFDLFADGVLDEARQLDSIRKALIATRSNLDPASTSAAELDKLIELATAAQDDLQNDARTEAILDAALGRSRWGVTDG